MIRAGRVCGDRERQDTCRLVNAFLQLRVICPVTDGPARLEYGLGQSLKWATPVIGVIYSNVDILPHW